MPYKNKEDRKLYMRKYRNDNHEELRYSQDGRCAICDKFFTNVRDICVDHDHKTAILYRFE